MPPDPPTSDNSGQQDRISNSAARYVCGDAIDEDRQVVTRTISDGRYVGIRHDRCQPDTYRHPRLNELARLDADWDSYGAPPLTEAALTAADRLVFVPTGDGGVQIELHSGGREVEITINEHGVIEAAWISGGVSVEQ